MCAAAKHTPEDVPVQLPTSNVLFGVTTCGDLSGTVGSRASRSSPWRMAVNWLFNMLPFSRNAAVAGRVVVAASVIAKSARVRRPSTTPRYPDIPWRPETVRVAKVTDRPRSDQAGAAGHCALPPGRRRSGAPGDSDPDPDPGRYGGERLCGSCRAESSPRRRPPRRCASPVASKLSCPLDMTACSEYPRACHEDGSPLQQPAA
jgi:hypothetical protein